MWCREVQEKSVIEKCWKRVLFRSGGENIGTNIFREVLEKKLGGEVSERIIGKTNYKNISYKNMGEI